MKEHTIRRATEEDLGTLARYRVKLFRELSQIPERESYEEFEVACRKALLGYFTQGIAMAWIAESGDGVPVGSIILLLHARLPSPRHPNPTEGYILNVFVDPEWRRMGIASGLTRAALDHARGLGLARIRLHSTPAGRPTYAGAGFRPREDEMELNLERES